MTKAPPIIGEGKFYLGWFAAYFLFVLVCSDWMLQLIAYWCVVIRFMIFFGHERTKIRSEFRLRAYFVQKWVLCEKDEDLVWIDLARRRLEDAGYIKYPPTKIRRLRMP